MQFAGPGYEFIQVFRVRSGVSPHPRKPDGKCRSKRVLNDHQCHKVIAFLNFCLRKVEIFMEPGLLIGQSWDTEPLIGREMSHGVHRLVSVIAGFIVA